MSTTTTTTATPAAHPWYREPWPWFVIALLSSAVIGASTCVYIAFKHEDAVVSQEWYQDGANINQTIDMEKRAVAMGLVASMLADPSTNTVTIELKAHQALPAGPLSLTLEHITDASRDASLTLTPQADGSYKGSLPHALLGRYYLTLKGGDWKMTDAEQFPQGQFSFEAHLDAGAGGKPVAG